MTARGPAPGPRAIRPAPPCVAGLLIAAGLALLTVPLPFYLIALVPVLVTAALALAPAARLDVVYDGACRVCRHAAGRFARLDWAGRVTWLDLLDWEAVSARHPTLDPVACRAALHVTSAEGRVYPGFDGLRALAARLPLLLPLYPLLLLPPVSGAGRWAYARLARRRRRDACPQGSCSLPDSPTR